MFEYTNEAHVFVMFLIILSTNSFILFTFSIILIFSINEYITQNVEFINNLEEFNKYKKYIIVPFQIMYFSTITGIILFTLIFGVKFEFKFMFH